MSEHEHLVGSILSPAPVPSGAQHPVAPSANNHTNDEVSFPHDASLSNNPGAMLPKPLGTMTYAEMSALIASLYFKNSALTTKAQQLTIENLRLRCKDRQSTLLLQQHAEYYENRLSILYAELNRVQKFADSIVNTI